MQARQLTATDALRRATDFDQHELSAAFAEASRAERASARIQLAFSLASLALVLALSLWLSRGILASVAALSNGFERFGRGILDEPIAVRARDELGMLAERANEMAQSLNRLEHERDRADWVKTGHARLMNELQGDLSPKDLAGRALRLLAEYLQLPAAACYRVAADGCLSQLAHYSLDAESDPGPASFRPGAGLIGQAASQTELILIENLPRDYLRIRSGLGEAPPSTLALLPIVHAGKVTGVLELACWKPWSAEHRELLLAVRESLGIAIEVATSGETQRALLAETQRQAQTLVAQEEQLRSANEGLQKQQEELREANEQLSAISRYKSQFLANMSHELRTPLNSMLLLSNLLAENESGNLTEKQTEYCRTIHGAGKDLLALINQVLDLAKIESGKQELRIESFSLRELIQGAERLVAPLAREKGLEFIAELLPDAPQTISSDRRKIEQILTNLLGNAVKFTTHGSVRLQIGTAPAETRFERGDLSAGRALAIIVRDTGIGIAPEHQRGVFVPFEQVDARPNRRYGGTGLGLSIARELSALLGGELQLQSTPGSGSTFTCYLPCAAAATIAAVPPASSAESAPAHTPIASTTRTEATQTPSSCVLVIEDDPVFAEAVCQIVQSQGLQCLLAVDGQTGLRLAKELIPDGIILDVRLPDVDGFAVMERLRADPITAGIAVHFVTEFDASERGMALGAVGYSSKPTSRHDLLKIIQALVPQANDGAGRVLIVEDDPDDAASMMRGLQGHGLVLRHAATAQDALRALRAQSFECVVLDLGLPDMDGITLLQTLQERPDGKAPSIVVHTGRPLTEAETQRIEAYADMVIAKSDQSVEHLLEPLRLFAKRLQNGAPISRRSVRPAARLDGLKILLVDDDMRTVYALSALLKAKGALIDVADTGRAALTELDAHPDVDLVLMDIMMPEMDGYEAMRRIRSDGRFPDLPIVALTAKAMKGDSELCLAAGATDYLPKPVDPERLISLLQSFEPRRLKRGA
jgi:CheY-like chemotaxis protein/signal transduction histidine kinase